MREPVLNIHVGMMTPELAGAFGSSQRLQAEAAVEASISEQAGLMELGVAVSVRTLHAGTASSRIEVQWLSADRGGVLQIAQRMRAEGFTCPLPGGGSTVVPCMPAASPKPADCRVITMHGLPYYARLEGITRMLLDACGYTTAVVVAEFLGRKAGAPPNVAAGGVVVAYVRPSPNSSDPMLWLVPDSITLDRECVRLVVSDREGERPYWALEQPPPPPPRPMSHSQRSSPSQRAAPGPLVVCGQGVHGQPRPQPSSGVAGQPAALVQPSRTVAPAPAAARLSSPPISTAPASPVRRQSASAPQPSARTPVQQPRQRGGCATPTA